MYFKSINCLVCRINIIFASFFSSELVYRLGRLPSDISVYKWKVSLPIGKNSTMFYSITRRLMPPLLNLFLLVGGASFGFFILQKNSPHDHFEKPGKSFVKVSIVYLISDWKKDNRYIDLKRHEYSLK